MWGRLPNEIVQEDRQENLKCPFVLALGLAEQILHVTRAIKR